MPDGTPTGGENRDESTQGESEDSKAAAGAELKFSDDDMAAAKASWAKRSKRDADKGATARDREILDNFEADSFEEIKELLTGKKQEQSDLEASVAEFKKTNRALKKDVEAGAEYQAKFESLIGRVNDAAKKDAVYAVAKAADAHEDLVHLKVASMLGVDEDGKVHVLGEDGEPAGTTLDTLIKKLVSDDQRLLRATAGAGGGSTPPAGAQQSGNGGKNVPWEQKLRDAAKEATVGNPYGPAGGNPWSAGK
jgi:hypothetical protein